MLEFISNYSGIVAIIVYSFILFLILKFRKPEEAEEEKEEEPAFEPERLPQLDLNDEDAVVASLIASIEAHNETHKNVRVVSVREVG